MEIWIGLASAFWIGVLTSISPCPLATNIAAISFISKKIGSKKSVFLTGFLYTVGRMFAYVVLSVIVMKSIYIIPNLSHFLQTQIYKISGPLLIIVGMFLLELISVNLPSIGSSDMIRKIFKNAGILGAFPLGIIFALSFCPVSAALFFGSLIPLSIKLSSSTLLPSMYGIGTGIPVFIFSVLMTFGGSLVGNVFKKVGKFEYWFRIATGVIFIGVGVYFCLVYIFEVI